MKRRLFNPSRKTSRRVTRGNVVRILPAAMDSELPDLQLESSLPRWTVETTLLSNGTYRVRVSDGLGRSSVGFGRDARAVIQQCVNEAKRQLGCSYTVVDGSIM